MAVTFAINASASEQLFATVLERLGDLSAPLDASRQYLLDSIQTNFEVGGRPDAWPPLAVPRPPGHSQNGVPLTDTGALRESIQGEAQGPTVVLWTDMLYAAIHQYGGTVTVPAIVPVNVKALHWNGSAGEVFAQSTHAHDVTIPARPFLVAQEEDVYWIEGTVTQYLLRDLP